MDYEKNKIKHLEFIQGVVTRMGYNSIILKMVSALLIVLIACFMDLTDYKVWSNSFLLILSFWTLDSHYLWQERIFRGIYNDVRKQNTSDFSMNVPAQLSKPGCKWINTLFSITITIPYAVLFVFILLISFKG